MRRIILSLLIIFLFSTPAYAQVDKAMHFVWSGAITACSYKAYDEAFVQRNLFGIKLTRTQALAFGMLTGIAFGVGKELIDKEFDGGDLAYDIAGVTAGAIFVITFDGDFGDWKL